MIRTALVIAFLVAPLAAASQTTQLPMGHVVCRTLSSAASITQARSTVANRDNAMELIQNGECILLPAGEQVLVQKRDGAFSCVSPVSGGQCGWTVLSSSRR